MKISFLIFWLFINFVAGLAAFNILSGTLSRAGHVRMNFQGRPIPTSLGAGYVLLFILVSLSVAFFTSGKAPDLLQPLLLLVMGFGFLGMIDDLVTGREPGGLKGHLSRLGAGGGVSTALLKAFFGVALSFTIMVLYRRWEGWFMISVDALVVALSANSINMLDVRPGRAVKGFVCVFSVILAGTIGGALFGVSQLAPSTLLLLVPFLIWTLAYAGLDFTCRAMMGDTGSNILGAVLGAFMVWELSNTNRWVCLALLIGFQLFCEAISLSSVIERISLLKKLDTFGIRSASGGVKAKD